MYAKALLAAAGVWIGALSAPLSAQAADAVKIGALMIDTGPLAGFHQYARAGLEVGVAETNAQGGVNGKPMELAFFTYAGTPESALQTASRMVRSAGVSAITGMMHSSIALALSPRATALDTIVIDGFSVAGTHCNANFFRVKASDAMQSASFGAYLQGSDVKSWDIVAADYSSGHDNSEAFQKIATAAGASIGKVLYTPQGTVDFGAQIAQLGQGPAEGLMAIVYGADAVAFAKQQKQFGLQAKYRIFLGNNFAVPAVLGGMGDAVEGVIQNITYVAHVEEPTGDTFRSRFLAHAGFEPDDVAFDQYLTIRALAQAMNAAGSEKAEEVAAAMTEVVLDSGLGPLAMRAEDHQMRRPMVFNRIVATGEGMDYQIERIIAAEDYMPGPSPTCKF